MRVAHQADAAGRQFGETFSSREHAHAGPQTGLRENRHRQSGEHGGCDRAGARTGIDHAIRPLHRLEFFDRDAPPAAGRTSERQRQALLGMRRMPRRGDPQQPLAAESLGGTLGLAIGDDGEIDLVGVDALEEIDRRFADHAQFDAGIGARKPRHDLGEITVGIVIGNTKANPARQFGIGEGGDGLDVELDDAPRVIEQALAVFGELGGAAVARKDGAGEALLQPFHLHRHRRLGLVHDLGGFGEAAGLGDGDKAAQLVDVEQRRHGGNP